MDLTSEAYKLLKENRRNVGPFQYTVPSPDTYPYQWLWDSCFHAIVLAKKHPDAAAAELASLVSKQFASGMIPHMIYWEPGSQHRYDWGVDGTSAVTQPPIIAYAAWEIYRHTNDQSILAELYPALIAYYRYLIAARDPRDHHLVGIINPDESGEDNSPRFDPVLNVPLDISYGDHLKRRVELVDANRTCHFDAELCMSKHFWVKDVPFNALLLENLRSMAHIASLLGHSDDEHFAKLHADLVAAAMRERMLENGVFWSTHGLQYEKIRVATWAHFAPLIADLYTAEEAAHVVATHFDDEGGLKAEWGIRTVSKREPSYRPDGFWRGPIWMAPHWCIYRGLIRYGFTKQAAWVRDRSIALIEKSGFREYFNPETGEGYGAHNFTWGTLVLDMMEE